jgi:hypothetical protein
MPAKETFESDINSMRLCLCLFILISFHVFLNTAFWLLYINKLYVELRYASK